MSLPTNDDVEVSHLIDVITAAFDGVPRGRIPIHEAEVINGYGTEVEHAAARERDREPRWQDIPDEHVEE